jgi:hypothetical protein
MDMQVFAVFVLAAIAMTVLTMTGIGRLGVGGNIGRVFAHWVAPLDKTVKKAFAQKAMIMRTKTPIKTRVPWGVSGSFFTVSLPAWNGSITAMVGAAPVKVTAPLRSVAQRR